MAYVIVRFLRNVDVEFEGEDGRRYGPFKAGQVIALPKRNASIFLKQGVAELVRKEKRKPTLKEKFKGEVLTGYVEAARVKPLTEFFEGKRKRDELLAEVEKLLEEMK